MLMARFSVCLHLSHAYIRNFLASLVFGCASRYSVDIRKQVLGFFWLRLVTPDQVQTGRASRWKQYAGDRPICRVPH
ncbi:hypothetical protein V1506DRAFT_527257 [Lipomyces tetrasporus]